MLIKDRHGNVLGGASAEAAALFDQAVEAFNLYRGDPMSLVGQAIDLAPEFAMAHLLKAHMLAMATEPQATVLAREAVAAVKQLRLSEREASHVMALDRILAGDWVAGAVALDRHNIDYPHDMVALQSGHLADFFRANARDLRDRIARVLPHWTPDMPGYPVVLGFYAFGLEEAGDYARAEETGRRAVELQPLDSWAHHAVAHVMEMQGRAQDGIGWMIAREPYWADDANFFKVHNWWHRALFHLGVGQTGAALALYDDKVRQDRSPAALNMIDASAMLWRLSLSGVDVGDRWVELAQAWDSHADGVTYPFNDWHAAMAYLGAGRDAEVDWLLAATRKADPSRSETAVWARQTAAPLIEGFAAFWRGDHATAAEKLFGARHIANTFGGSHAQRDIIDWTLTEAAVRGNMPALAEALAHERLALKPHSPLNRAFLRRARAAGNLRQAA